MEVSFHGRDWLSHWPLAIELELWGEAEGFSPPITFFIPLATSPHPYVTQGLSKYHLINRTKGTLVALDT